MVKKTRQGPATRPPQSPMRQRVLDVTRERLGSEGLAHLTIQGVADALGVTKQAVLYWFPSRNALLRELFFEGIEAESAVLVAAAERSESAAEAIERFLREGFAHHKRALGTFRLTYLVGQLERSVHDLIDPTMAEERLYPVTSRAYAALEARLEEDPAFPRHVNARTFAVSLHMTLLGHVLMYGLTEATGDSFRQPFEDMLDASLAVLREGLREERQASSSPGRAARSSPPPRGAR